MKKIIFISLLSFFSISFAVFGQASGVPVIKIETPEIVAEVNGDKITRSSLAAECLQLHGERELQELIGNTLIRLECERQKLTVTPAEINAEILHMAGIHKMSSEELLQLYEKKYGRSAEEYRYTTWRILALGKLAGQRLVITDAELQMRYEREYGAAVKARQIVLATQAEAAAVLAEVKQFPETFGKVAQNRSIDTMTQPYAGALNPIRRHSYNPDIENMLFAMKPGEISPVVEFPKGYFTIYKCEEHLKPLNVDFEAVRQKLKQDMRDEKLPHVANEIFQELQSRTKVQVVFGEPVLYTRYPGVAAVLDEKTFISQQELAEACIRKYGKDVLGDMIYRQLIEQACRREKIVISEQDIDKEIAEMAFHQLPLKQDGSADTALWLKRATEATGLSVLMYRKNVVVPGLSLKRLTRHLVQVTEKDIQLAFEANFGKKVRCLAIVFDASSQRRAGEVWNMANQNRTEEAFGDLAERYSFDPESRLGRGVIPPIARHCGNPELENEAFSLNPGEISRLFQVEDALVILYCIGYVDPLPVKIEDVRLDLTAELFVRKQQVIIAGYLDKVLRAQATIDNYLTGESLKPAVETAASSERSQNR